MNAPPTHKMTFTWNQLDVETWTDLLSQVPKSNLLQTWAYAKTMRETQQLSTRFAEIMRGEERLGLFQIQEINLLGLIHFVILDRGPLWLKKPSAQDWQDFIETYAETFPKRLGRFRRFMPELEEDTAPTTSFAECGFRHKHPGYQSIWLDLTPDTDTLRSGLKQKWRNRLNVAEKVTLDIERASPHPHIDWLLSLYMEDRRKRNYPGPDAKLVKSLVKNAPSDDDVLLLRALQDGKPIAAILVIRHGKAATYQVGWTNEEGRKASAHHLLLWKAIEDLKSSGTTWFDLGGINPESAEGVSKFKAGLGGKAFKLAGLYK